MAVVTLTGLCDGLRLRRLSEPVKNAQNILFLRDGRSVGRSSLNGW